MNNNEFVHAVAGARKTQRVVDLCADSAPQTQTLVLTYTQANQDQLRRRISERVGASSDIVVMGWFQFLLQHWVRPFVPYLFVNRRVRGFSFDGDPGRVAGERRFLTRADAAYRLHLSSFAYQVEARSKGALLGRMERIYDRIIFDEVQDLNGWDLEVMSRLLDSRLPIWMVGDIRQAILLTNPQDPKNKQYKFSAVIDWFRAQEKKDRLTIKEEYTTWRCHPAIAAFAGSIFDESWNFKPTKSMNTTTTDHDGVYLVHPDHVEQYLELFTPNALRFSAVSGKSHALDYSNFGEAKGLTHERVLVAPTKAFEKFIQSGVHVSGTTACKFYVAVTRAKQSVGIIIDKPGASPLPVWVPPS